MKKTIIYCDICDCVIEKNFNNFQLGTIKVTIFDDHTSMDLCHCCSRLKLMEAVRTLPSPVDSLGLGYKAPTNNPMDRAL